MSDEELKNIASASRELVKRCVQETNYRQMIDQQRPMLKFIEEMKPFIIPELNLELNDRHLIVAWQLVEAMQYAIVDEKTRDIACFVRSIGDTSDKNNRAVEVTASRKNIWARFLRRILAQPGTIHMPNIKVLGAMKDKKTREVMEKKIAYFEERRESYSCFDRFISGNGSVGMRFWYSETLCDEIWLESKTMLYERGTSFHGVSQIQSLAQDLGIDFSKENKLMHWIFYYAVSSSFQKMNLLEWIHHCNNVCHDDNKLKNYNDNDNDDW